MMLGLFVIDKKVVAADPLTPPQSPSTVHHAEAGTRIWCKWGVWC